MHNDLQHLSATTPEGDDLILLPTMQLAKLHHEEPNGKKVYINADGILLCPHGEKSSTICSYISAEQRARQRGEEPPPRGGSRGISCCDCQNTEGLHVYKQTTTPFTPPDSLFDFLTMADTPTITVKGHLARKVPIPGPCDTYLSDYGTLLCKHGCSRRALQSGKAKCSCTLHPLPNRRSNVGLKLGCFKGVYGSAKAITKVRLDASPLTERAVSAESGAPTP